MNNNNKTKFTTRGISIKKELAKELLKTNNDIKEKKEVIREDMHNSYDADANDFYITCTYKKDNDILNLFIRHDGKPFVDLQDILDSLLYVGKSDKIEGIYIGGKGVGNKLNLLANKLVIESINAKEKVTVIIVDALKQLEKVVDGTCKKLEVKYKVSKKEENEEVGVKISLLELNVFDKLAFSHRALKQYIKSFTIMGPIGDNKKNFNVHLKGLEFSEESLKRKDIGNHRDGQVINNYKVFIDTIRTKEEFEIINIRNSRNELKKIINDNKGKLLYFNEQGKGFENNKEEFKEIKKLCNSLKFGEITFSILWTIDNEIKIKINPLIKKNSSISVNHSDFFGVYPACNNIIVPTFITKNNFKGGGNAAVQYLGVINYNDLYLKTDRNDIGGTNKNIIFINTAKKIINIVSKIVFDKKNSKEETDKNDIDLNKEKIERINSYLNRKKIKSQINGYKFIIPESAYEMEVFGDYIISVVLNLIDFVAISVNPHKGLDLLCCKRNIIFEGNPDLECLERECFWVELKHILEDKINHKFDDISKILCWEINKNLRFGKKSIIKDKENNEYKLVKNNNKYKLMDPNNEHNVIGIIELKTIFEEHLKKRFR